MRFPLLLALGLAIFSMAPEPAWPLSTPAGTMRHPRPARNSAAEKRSIRLERPVRTESVPADSSWDDRFCATGVRWEVYCLAADGFGNLYAGGMGVSRWDGTSWSLLSSQLYCTTNAVVVDNNGTIYAGGWFPEIEPGITHYVAKWDGTKWCTLGSGVNGDVNALAVDAGGNLYVGGQFTAAGGISVNNIARWDGTSWSALGSGVGAEVLSLVLDGGNLYAGGLFTTAGSVNANYVAKWNGSTWSALASGVGDWVSSLAVAGGNLYAGGWFTTAGSVNANHVAKWNGTSWSALGSGAGNFLGYDTVQSLAVDDSGNLYAGGWFTTAGGASANRIAKWNGSTWSSLGSGMNDGVAALTISGGTLYAGGYFTAAGDHVVNFVSQWNGTNWSPMGCLGNGVTHTVWALARDGGGNVYAGGDLVTAADLTVCNIARWNGTGWSGLGSGVSGSITALAAGQSGSLYAGGWFTTSGPIGTRYVSRWDGATWSALGSGLGSPVEALVVDGAGNLFAGGRFTTAGGMPANYVARWDGTAWSPLGSGMDDHVYALALDAAGNLYAGGKFTMAGGVGANRVAKWDGTNWSALGTGVDSAVYSLAAYGGKIYAGGLFTTAGGVSANKVAKWDGSGWSAVGSGMNGNVFALSAGSWGLYAGGHFTTAGGDSANRVARWDGSSWSALGSGVGGGVNALLADDSGDLYVGGYFLTAGSKPSWGIGIWHGGLLQACEVAPTWLDFGSVPVGGTAEKSFAIRNTGGDLLSGSVSESCDSYSLVSGGGAFSLAPGDSVVVVVRFSPTALGTFACTIITGVPTCGDVACSGSGKVGFTNIGAGLPAVSRSSAAWGDYDNDGDLDILLAGNGPGYISEVYRNDGGLFTAIGAGLTGVQFCSVAWGDYDNDGDLDILLVGDTGAERISRVYRNAGGVFTDIGAGLPGVEQGSAEWSDLDNDGDLDILLTGYTGSEYLSRIYRNSGGIFTDANAGLAGIFQGAAACADYDNDGDMDILLAGESGTGRLSRLYRNDAGNFTDTGASLTGVCYASLAWGDYDSDGDPDIVLSGESAAGIVSYIYRNDGGVFTDINAALTGVRNGSAGWGDYDNDGDLDLVMAGWAGSGVDLSSVSQVYRNDGGVFIDSEAGLPGVTTAAWGDYDNDGSLDILLTGFNDSLGDISRVYRSYGAPPNSAPVAPGGLAASVDWDNVTLSWSAASDAATPAAGLSYNLRIGTTPGGNEISAAMANSVNGYRRVTARGNAQQRTSWTLRMPAVGTCYWSVQAVDGAYAGSPFAPEGSYVVAEVTFTEVAAGLPGVRRSSAAWGDYDNDGDLDLLLTGLMGSSGRLSRLYRNDGEAGFTDVVAGLPDVGYSSVAWGDYDNDSDLDILLTGDTGAGYLSRVYRNDNGTFVDAGADLPAVAFSSVAWGDYDNDGDLDILLTGKTGTPEILARVYRNEGGVFTDINAGLQGIYVGSATWSDYDNDGDLDIFTTGASAIGNLSRLYRNDSGAFTFVESGIVGTSIGSAAWGDYDSDGDLDILLTGDTGFGYVSRIYRNDGSGIFSDIGAGLPGVDYSSAAWGDFDNDGDLDILLTGAPDASEPISHVYQNRGAGSFAEVNVGLPGVRGSSASWSDYDNDGDLDILLTGSLGGISNPVSRLYRSAGAPANTPPAAPGGLTCSLVGNELVLGWNASSDTQTPSAGLSYNVRVGTIPGGSQICSSMANSTDGYRRIVAPGNAQMRTTWTLLVPAGVGNCYWSVQSVDGAFAGSPFAAEQSIAVSGVSEPGIPVNLSFDAVADPAGSVRLLFGLPAPADVRISIYDVAGRRVAQLLDGARSAGYHAVDWSSRPPAADGVYFARLTTANQAITRMLVVIH